MIRVEAPRPSPEPSFPPSLADLSRNASVISSSSSSDSTSSLILNNPRPRPIRTFSSPRTNNVTQPAPRSNSRPPAYLTAGMGKPDDGTSTEARRIAARTRSQSRNRAVTAEDFEFGDELGEGSYSTVKQATHLRSGQEFAIKILDKAHLRRHNKLEIPLAEKNTLARLGSGHPGIARLHFTFQDEWSLFFVLDLARNGEMQTRISRLGSLSTECARYYSAQIVDALDYIHGKGVLHRDLKPENLLLDDDFRIKITDFGTGKLLDPGAESTKTFVGSAQYVSPELLEANETSKSSDLWSLGCIIYQMIAGRFAFTGLSEYLTFQKIKQLDYSFPDGFDPEAKDLIQKIIVRDPAERLGAGPPGSSNSMEALRAHPFFSTINWKTLWTQPAPPLEPGMVKREHPLSGQDQNWEDVGASWDDIEEDEEGDGIRWADDAVGPAYVIKKGYGDKDTCSEIGSYSHSEHDEVGPMGEIPHYASRIRTGRVLEEDSETITGHESPQSGTGTSTAVDDFEPIYVPGIPNVETASAGSATSSSDGSPVEKLGAALEVMEVDRGRNRAQTPLQANVPPAESDWSSLLLPDEHILFTSQLEARGLRRRASRLIPITVSPLKPKVRQLILTNQRLVCVKQRPRDISVKSELTLRSSNATVKDKDSRSWVTTVESKSDKEFVVMTSGKSQTYAAADASLASSWVEKIKSALPEQNISRT